ncbi:DUF6973 domain-containing protein [Nocardia concava]|uniref:DUF6973 domain-containing protein n=1 Tax=Nocardia concava TaxID=257281 RepID=UPI0002E85DDA|nr:hypothetical protein [Nocardia concava]
MSDEKLKISEILAWDLSALSLVAAKVQQASTTVEQEVTNADDKVQKSGDWFGDKAGEAARGMSTKFKTDGHATADSYKNMARAIDDANHELETKIATLRSVVKEVEESKWDFAYKDTTGDVYSRKSNWKTATSTSPYGAAAVALKTAAQISLTSDLTQALYDVKEIDKLGAQAVARCLETLTDSVKKTVVAMPADEGLAQILQDYQTDDSESGTKLWPDNTLLNILRTMYPDLEPIEMTGEEADALDELANPLRGGNPANALKFFNLKNEAEALGGNADNPNANKYTMENPNSFADGHADALRHTYWNARMSQEFGEDWTKKYTTAHEKGAGNPPAREAMDLFNNERGRQIAKDNPGASPDELKARIIESIDRGEMVVIAQPTPDSTPQLARSNVPVTTTAIIAGTDIPLPRGKF